MPQSARVARLIEELKKQRDELAVRAHLGSKEAQEEWQQVTAKLQDLIDRYKPVQDATQETGENVWAAMKLLGEEVRAGLNRIRKSL